MDVFLDPASAVGVKTNSLFEQLREAIVSGRLVAGDRLPPTRDLADQLGISRSTVTTAYGRLGAEGYIDGRAGAGSFVNPGLTTTRPHDHTPAALQAVARMARSSPTQWSIGGFDSSPPRYDLRSGRPDPALFPLVEWRRCTTTALQTAPPAYENPAGNDGLRRVIAHWIGRSRAVETSPDQVIITSGAQQGIDLVTRLLTAPGHSVAIEDPGYPPVAGLLAASGANVVAVPIDTEGIVVSKIPEQTRLIYTTPSHQSPTGVVMSMARRQELLRFAEHHDVAIIEDDYDSEYRHSDRPLEPLHRLDQSGRVIYVGTFSKTLSPSLRLGFVVLPPPLVEPAVGLRLLVDWQPPATTQVALQRFIADGHLERHLRRSRKIYRQRHQIVSEFVDRAVADGLLVAPEPSYAGLHITAMLAKGISETAVHDASGVRGIALGRYAQCWHRPDPPDGLIIGFGSTPTRQLPDALDALECSLVTASQQRN